jgi:hypothetical protein
METKLNDGKKYGELDYDLNSSEPSNFVSHNKLDFSADLPPENIGLYNKKTIEKIIASIKRKSVMILPNK